MSLPAYLPSPSNGQLNLGPIPLRAYGLCIAAGVYAAVVMAARRLRARGGAPELITTLAVWAVPAGIIGARLYHVATDYELYTHHWVEALKIWDGGLGIWGGVLAGTAVGAWVARRQGADARLLLDVVAPALPLAQAIGRWGNWFNQELFGRPSKLPWALKIDIAHRPLGYLSSATFQPTFLYESLWDLAVVGLVLLAGRRLKLRKGYLFAVYVTLYTFGRFWVELLRIDFAHKFWGLRLNDWTSIVVFAGGCVFIAMGLRAEPAVATAVDEPAEATTATAADQEPTPDPTGGPGTPA